MGSLMYMYASDPKNKNKKESGLLSQMKKSNKKDDTIYDLNNNNTIIRYICSETCVAEGCEGRRYKISYLTVTYTDTHGDKLNLGP